jgi:hypothetical protein
MERTTANETFLDDKKYNIWAIRTGAIVAEAINYSKLINAYLKKNEQPLDRLEEYMSKYTKDEFCDLLLQFYDIKGVITPDKILKAKKRSLDGSNLSEYEEQKIFVKWLRDNKIKCASSGNGFALNTQDNVMYMAKLKASGLSKGFPDLEVFIGNGKSLYIEMKRKKGGVVSEEQKKWVDWLNNNGYSAKVCHGADEAIEYVKGFIDD